LFGRSRVHIEVLLIQFNVEFHVERLRRIPGNAITLIDPVCREGDPRDQLPIIEINTLPHVAPEIPEIVKHLSGLYGVRQMVERIEEYPDRNMPPAKCHDGMGCRSQNHRRFIVQVGGFGSRQ
jgi:hypothetical protein